VEPEHFFSFLILYTVGRTPWTRISPSQGRYLHTEQHKHRINTHRQSCLQWGSNPTVHALDRAATVIGTFWPTLRNVLSHFCFIYSCLFKIVEGWAGLVSILDYLVSNVTMTTVNELETIWQEVIVACLRYCPGIWLEGRKKGMKNRSYYNQCPGRDSNRAPPIMNIWSASATPQNIGREG
jgi:hypothetical protein